MTTNDDFSPIAEQGELDSEGGLFSRLKRRKEVAPATPGFARIWLDEQSAPIDEVTAGQKYWSRARSWVKVDVRDHHLSYEIEFPDPSGLAGFVAVIDVTVRISDPHSAVKHGAESVRDVVRPALQRAIRRAHGSSSAVDGEDSPVDVLNDLRLAASTNLEALDGSVSGIPNWMEVGISSIEVSFDEATAKHRTELMERMRATALADADGATELARARSDLKVRQLWEEGFAKRLADPERRALARIAADPSRENIDRVASQFDQIEAQGRAAIVQVLSEAVNNGYFAEDDAIYNAIDAVAKQYDNPQHALGQGEVTREVSAPDDSEQTVEAETVETESESETDKEQDRQPSEKSGEKDGPSDTDWGKET